MKFVIFLTVLMVLGIRGEPESGYVDEDTVLTKDQFRTFLKGYLNDTLGKDADDLCTHYLSANQTVFANQKLAELVACGMATIDTFIDKIDFDVKLVDFSSTTTLRNYIGPMCQVFDDIYKCIRGVEPVIDLCISPNEKQFKTRLFTIVPLLQQTVCLKNGDLLADLFEHVDLMRCAEPTVEWITNIGFDDIFNDINVVEYFGSEPMCREFNRLRLEMYNKIGECSTGILDIVSEMMGYFCEGTKCNRFIRDLECF